MKMSEDSQPGAGERPNRLRRRLATAVVGTAAIAATIGLGGAGTFVTAFANSGAVSTSQTCTTWSASVTLAHNVSPDKYVDVVTTIPGTRGLTNQHYNTSFGEIWNDTGAAPTTGTVTLTIYNADGVDGARGSIEFTQSRSLPSAPDCVTTPAIATTPAGTSVPVGTTIHDQATVTGSGASPAGTVTFRLYAPSNPTCDVETGSVFTSSPVSLVSTSPGVSTATGSGYTPVTPGTYRWVAAYSGDDGHYNPVSSNCADEAVLVSKAAPAIATAQTAGGSIGVVLSDTATVSGGSSPTGTVTFALYPPSNPTCIATGTAPVYTSPAEALSGGRASSGSYTTTASAGAGTYQWIATYSGDANNTGVASACNTEAVVISTGGGSTGGGPPTITTPSTGAGFGGLTAGGILVLGGLGIALISAIVPRRRSA